MTTTSRAVPLSRLRKATVCGKPRAWGASPRKPFQPQRYYLQAETALHYSIPREGYPVTNVTSRRLRRHQAIGIFRSVIILGDQCGVWGVWWS